MKQFLIRIAGAEIEDAAQAPLKLNMAATQPWPTWAYGGVLLTALMMSACKPASQSTTQRLADYQARLQACVDSMETKSRIPIMGGGEIDTSRFAFHVPNMNVTDEGECGAVGFEAEFYWTGDKIVPNSPKFTGLRLSEIPREWRLLRVGPALATGDWASNAKSTLTR